LNKLKRLASDPKVSEFERSRDTLWRPKWGFLYHPKWNFLRHLNRHAKAFWWFLLTRSRCCAKTQTSKDWGHFYWETRKNNGLRILCAIYLLRRRMPKYDLLKDWRRESFGPAIRSIFLRKEGLSMAAQRPLDLVSFAFIRWLLFKPHFADFSLFTPLLQAIVARNAEFAW